MNKNDVDESDVNEAGVPDAGFVSHLEWELQSVMRRQARLDGTSSAARRGGARLAAIVGLAAVSMSVGGAGTYAAIYTVDERAAALHVARAEAQLEIARTRLDPPAQELARMQELYQQGGVAERELRQAEAAYVQTQSDVKARELDLVETRLTGRAPNDALSAPLVKGRDFVTERLFERRRPMQLQLDLLADQDRRLQELSDAGAATMSELKAAQLQLAGADQALAALEKRVTLRASFLVGKLSAAQVELEGMRLSAVTGREMAVYQAVILADQQQRLANLSKRGMVSDAELRTIEAQLHEVKTQIDLADLELHVLDQKLRDAARK